VGNRWDCSQGPPGLFSLFPPTRQEIAMPAVRRVTAFLVLCLFASVSIAADLPRGDPESVGLSSERLGRIKEVFDAKVKAGDFPGYVALVARKGKVVYHEAYGVQNLATKTPMAKDSIFRVYSMTKPIVSVAAMILVEEGKMKLSDPVSMYLPELKDLQVVEEAADVKDPALMKTHAAKNPIRVLDLLIHTSGFSYAFFKNFPGGGALEQMYIDNKVGEFDVTNEEFVKLIAKMPLRYEPGTTWWYSHSTDVLGRLIEVVSGMTLGEFVEKRIAQPLKMEDTAFAVAQDKVARFAEPFDGDKEGLILQYTDPTKPVKWEAGGHGLTATVMDYARFAHMLLNKGSLEGQRVLGKKTVELMTMDHVGSVFERGPAYLPGQGHGFGLLGAVRTEGPRAPAGLNPMDGSVGEFYWAGYAGTFFWVDPKEELVAVYMMQSVRQLVPAATSFKTMVEQAIVE
jgi:CubicO group peptidase (beta-lactamase class C family)